MGVKVDRLVVKKNGLDVTDDCDLADGKRNPFGWSQYRIIHRERAGMADVETFVGWLESGEPMDVVAPYTAEIIEDELPDGDPRVHSA